MEESQSPQLHRMSSHPHLHFAHASSAQRTSSPSPNLTSNPTPEVNNAPEPRESVLTVVPRHVEEAEVNDTGRPASHEGASQEGGRATSPGATASGYSEEGRRVKDEENEEAEDEVEDLSVGGRAREVGSVVAFVPGDSSRREGVVVMAERMEEGRIGGPISKAEEVMD